MGGGGTHWAGTGGIGNSPASSPACNCLQLSAPACASYRPSPSDCRSTRLPSLPCLPSSLFLFFFIDFFIIISSTPSGGLPPPPPYISQPLSHLLHLLPSRSAWLPEGDTHLSPSYLRTCVCRVALRSPAWRCCLLAPPQGRVRNQPTRFLPPRATGLVSHQIHDGLRPPQPITNLDAPHRPRLPSLPHSSLACLSRLRRPTRRPTRPSSPSWPACCRRARASQPPLPAVIIPTLGPFALQQ